MSSISSPTIYMQGTRRIDEMAANARQLAYQENYSYTEGWDDNTVGEVFNLGLNQLYDRICQIDNVANIQEFTTDVFATQQSYPIPIDVKMAVQIMNVRYLYGPETWQFVTLEQGMIQDRYSYPTNIPTTYCIRNGYMLLSPTPNITRPNSLIVNYQKRMRKLDYRRGLVTGIVPTFTIANPTPPPLTLTYPTFGNITTISNSNPCKISTAAPHGLVNGQKVGLSGIFQPSQLEGQSFIITYVDPTNFTLNGVDSTNFNVFSGTAIYFVNPVQFQLNFTITSQKDVNMQANANSVLDKIDWICFVDRNGLPVIDAIPINSYNPTTMIVTTESNYVIPYASWLQLLALETNQDDVYVVGGDYSSTHSELDRQAEDLLIEYCVLRLLRLQSAAEPTADQSAAENAVLDRLSIAYRRYRPSVIPIIYMQRLRTRSWHWGGRGPYDLAPAIFLAYVLGKWISSFF